MRYDIVIITCFLIYIPAVFLSFEIAYICIRCLLYTSSDQVFFPRGIRHGTAFAVDASIVESLIADRNYNPLIPDNLADPSVSKFGDNYYLYGLSLIHI